LRTDNVEYYIADCRVLCLRKRDKREGEDEALGDKGGDVLGVAVGEAVVVVGVVERDALG